MPINSRARSEHGRLPPRLARTLCRGGLSGHRVLRPLRDLFRRRNSRVLPRRCPTITPRSAGPPAPTSTSSVPWSSTGGRCASTRLSRSRSRSARIGRTSLTFAPAIRVAGEAEPRATGEVVWVHADQATMRAVPLPDAPCWSGSRFVRPVSVERSCGCVSNPGTVNSSEVSRLRCRDRRGRSGGTVRRSQARRGRRRRARGRSAGPDRRPHPYRAPSTATRSSTTAASGNDSGQDRILTLARELGVSWFPSWGEGASVDWFQGVRCTYDGMSPPSAPEAEPAARGPGTPAMRAPSLASNLPSVALTAEITERMAAPRDRVIPAPMIAPALVAHADWSMHAAKRLMARAVLRPEGYLALPATPVGALESFWTRLAAAAGAGPVLLGFDFPIGLPAAYAERVGIADFLDALDSFGGDFYEVARTPEQIALRRPFYPHRPGGRCRQQLLDGLGFELWRHLHRRCDGSDLGAPGCLPRCSGPSAAIRWAGRRSPVGATCWRRRGGTARTWRSGPSMVRCPLCSAPAGSSSPRPYPGEVYGHLGMALRAHGGKRRQAARLANAARLLAWAEHSEIALAPELHAEIATGFGGDPGADDRLRCRGRSVRPVERPPGRSPERRAGRPGGASDRGLDPGAGCRAYHD